MKTLLELKTSIITFVEKYEYNVLCVARLILLAAAFLMVQTNICYLTKIDSIFIAIILAVVCAVVPVAIGSFVLAAYILVCLSGLGMEVAAVVGAVFLMLYLLYFRFAPGTAYRVVLTPVLMVTKMPYILPITCGLSGTPGDVVAVLGGMIIFFMLKGIKINEAVFLGNGDLSSIEKASLVLSEFIRSKELWVMIVAFFLTTILVYTIRRLSIKNAWRTAYIVGSVFNMVVLLCGKLVFGTNEGILWLIIGSIVSIGIAYVYEFIFMNLDYTRVEHAQFEDDNYYYYVKAVPKVLVQAKQKSIKHFNQKNDEKDDNEKKEQLAKELEIDRSLLK